MSLVCIQKARTAPDFQPTVPALWRGWLVTVKASQPVKREIKLADLTNGFANNRCGRLRMQLDQAAVRDPGEQAYPTSTD